MSRLEVPIKGRTLRATGDVLLWIELDLLLKDASGSWQAQPFRVDTGAEMSTMSAHEAKLLGLPMPRHATPGAVHVQTGLTFRLGYLRFQIVGMDPTEYVIACLFLGDPNIPPTSARSATLPRKLLQPFQLLDRLRFTLDKDPAAGSLHGMLIVEKR